MSSAPTVVVYGPMGCGKTLNAPKLARHYCGIATWLQWECGELLREPDGGRTREIPARGALVLCTDGEIAHLRRRLPPGTRVIRFAQACREAGIKKPLPHAARR